MLSKDSYLDRQKLHLNKFNSKSKGIVKPQTSKPNKPPSQDQDNKRNFESVGSVADST